MLSRLYHNRQGLTKGKRKATKKVGACQKKAASEQAQRAAQVKKKAAKSTQAIQNAA